MVLQEFRADLHIHSRFSRATSRSLTAPVLAAWAAIKGLQVIGTGDFTHPAWRAELAEMLVLDEMSGLYKLKDAALAASGLPDWADTPELREKAANVRFMLQAEISSIYKRDGKVRKVHNLVYMPSLEDASSFSSYLAQMGNIESDGRPILGLDCEDLMEMVLDSCPGAFLVPAHIWTPWFSLFGSKSGFDRIEDCYGSLASEIFALETGLSSDPEMNRCLSSLDRFKLVSNSDAHSGENLAREANIFVGGISYMGIYNALKAPWGQDGNLGTRFRGTLEFFPDEGKYHLDGHRECKVCMTPQETKEARGICPVCGKPMTVGVLYRVQELADRAEPQYNQDEEFYSLIPLAEIMAEIIGAGPKTRKVTDLYQLAIRRLGSELDILRQAPLSDIAEISKPLAEGIKRMRSREVVRQGGFDGEFGVISVFSPEERKELGSRGTIQGRKLTALSLLPDAPAPKVSTRKKKDKKEATPAPSTVAEEETEFDFSAEVVCNDSPSIVPEAEPIKKCLNVMQEAAVSAGPGPVLVLAGPGTGKTHTLVERIRRLIGAGLQSRQILAVTFTRRAASELAERLATLLDDFGLADLPRADTLHALAVEFWVRVQGTAPMLLNEEAALRVFAETNSMETAASRKAAWEKIALCRECLREVPAEYQDFYLRYSQHKSAWNLADYTDLLEFWLTQARTGQFPLPWTEVLVDEVQDLSPLQLELVECLVPQGGMGFFGIGDPGQSIYGFRGAHGNVQEFFKAIWPDMQLIRLDENYRSGTTVLNFTQRLLFEDESERLKAMQSLPSEVQFFEANSAESEATWVVGQIRRLIGATSHTLQDRESKKGGMFALGSYSPGDFAILLRNRSLMQPYRRALDRAGIAVSQPAVDLFWEDARVGKILEVAGRILGISASLPEKVAGRTVQELECPPAVLAHGPLSMAAYWGTCEPFDKLFWQSAAFKDLVKHFDAHKGWAGLLNWVSLQSELENVRQKSQTVQLITIHASKGLEFPMVFMPALEDGILPFAGAAFLNGKLSDERPDNEEEKRLFYVGMTRAKEGLFLSYSARRHIYGKELRLQPSRFLNLLPMEQTRHSAMVKRHNVSEQQLKLF